MKLCQYDGCRKGAWYGNEKGKPFRCGEHREEDLTNVVSKRCQYNGCEKHPYYGKEMGIATHCKTHGAPIGLVDVKSNFCKSDGCKTRASFGVDGGRAIFCTKHKEDTMTNIHTKICEMCAVSATYGDKNSRRTRCSTHKTEHMICVQGMCEVDNCGTMGYFGFAHIGKKQRCSAHKLPGMVDLKNKKCTDLGCSKQSTYGFENGPIEKCATHKLPGMVDVKNKRCPTCKYVVTNGKTCISCNGHVRRELVFRDMLLERGYVFETHNKTTGCGRERPDFVFDCDTHAVVLEYDEYQHKHSGYTTECELVRMKNLYYALGFERCAFVRFNPDEYINENKVTNTHETERYDVLFDTLNESMSIPPSNNAEIVYLFYDGSHKRTGILDIL